MAAMADESMEPDLATATEGTLPADAAGDAQVWLLAVPSQRHRLFQDAGAHNDVVSAMIDETFGPSTSDLDEQMLEQQTPGRPGLLILYVLASSGEFGIQAILRMFEEEAYRNGGFGAVPASAAAVAGLEKKQAFRAAGAGGDGGGVTGCAICLEDFEDGEEVSAMPCGRGHEFHPECISKWLGCSNMCPLCRHALPTDVDHQ
ncbi:hypothetical protein ACP70R_020437 [Stipagrostis hirtigluma subsp. patula]